MQQIYDSMWNNSAKFVAEGVYQIDDLIDNANDTRTGITLLLYPSMLVKKQILNFLDYLQQREPLQYYYPSEDMHGTVLSIISCRENFSLDETDVAEYVRVLSNALQDLPPFEIHYKGVTMSNSCVMIQGFTQADTLFLIRERVRQYVKNSELQHSMDTRYVIQTAHSTVVRFRKPLQNPQLFVQSVEQYRTFDFGVSKIDSLSLVYNDWYQRHEKVKVLHTFHL